MEKYNKEDFETDCEWLRGQGVLTEEIEYFVRNLLTKGFILTKEEYVDLMEEIE